MNIFVLNENSCKILQFSRKTRAANTSDMLVVLLLLVFFLTSIVECSQLVDLHYLNSNDDLNEFKNFFSYQYKMRRLEIDSLSKNNNQIKSESSRRKKHKPGKP